MYNVMNKEKIVSERMAFTFAPLKLHACVYVLQLENDCIYVGATMNFNVRMAQHFAGVGSKWTKLHKPLGIIEVLYPFTPNLENRVTQKYFDLKGHEKVRGGSWCRVKQKQCEPKKANQNIVVLDMCTHASDEDEDEDEEESDEDEEECGRCGRKGHDSSNCYAKIHSDGSKL